MERPVAAGRFSSKKKGTDGGFCRAAGGFGAVRQRQAPGGFDIFLQTKCGGGFDVFAHVWYIVT